MQLATKNWKDSNLILTFSGQYHFAYLRIGWKKKKFKLKWNNSFTTSIQL